MSACRVPLIATTAVPVIKTITITTITITVAIVTTSTTQNTTRGSSQGPHHPAVARPTRSSQAWLQDLARVSVRSSERSPVASESTALPSQATPASSGVLSAPP